MEKFAGYGFNKSHSAAYALIAYHTAWLKAHYPAAFMAAAMSADIDNTDKLVVLKDDCGALGIRLVPPDVNSSEYEFAVADDRSVQYGLGAIKGVGQGVVEAIVNERRGGGRFADLLDLCRRVGSAGLNRRVLEALVRSGALDSLGMNRATLMNAIPDALKLAGNALSATAAGQTALFGPEDDAGGLSHEFTVLREWNAREKLEAEREALGLYLTGHPFTNYAEHCRNFTHGSIANVLGALPEGDGLYRYRKEVSFAGVVMDISRRGSRVSIVLDDNTERIEVTLFEDVYQQVRHIVNKHAILVVHGQLRYDDFLNGWRLNAQRVQSVDDAIEAHARRLTICVSSERLGTDFVESLKDALQPFRRGACEVCIRYESNAALAVLTLGDAWTVHATRELRERLTSLVGERQVSVHYARQPSIN
jgi:DNA polymerase-3 subunit alpha